MYPLSTKVMVVDDVLATRKMVARGLKDLGFLDVVEAADGARAWELLNGAESGVGLIISDWNMPKLTGIELLKLVREHFAQLPFFLLTAEAEQQNVREAIQLRVTGYIIKPFTVAVLKSRLERGAIST